MRGFSVGALIYCQKDGKTLHFCTFGVAPMPMKMGKELWMALKFGRWKNISFMNQYGCRKWLFLKLLVRCSSVYLPCRWIRILELLSSGCPPGGPQKRRSSSQRLWDGYSLLRDTRNFENIRRGTTPSLSPTLHCQTVRTLMHLIMNPWLWWMNCKNQNLSGVITPPLVFLLLRRSGCSPQCDTLSILRVIHHNEPDWLQQRGDSSTFSTTHNLFCVCAAALEPQTWWSVERINQLCVVAGSQTNSFIWKWGKRELMRFSRRYFIFNNKVLN